MELMALATSSVTNLLPELPDSPFDNDSFGKECYPSLGRDGSLGGKDRDSGSGGGLGVDADCIFAYDDNDRYSESCDGDGGAEDMPFAWAQPNADMFEFDRSFSGGKLEGVNGAALSGSTSQSFIAQQCMAPPVLSSFEQSSGYGRQSELVGDVICCV